MAGQKWRGMGALLQGHSPFRPRTREPYDGESGLAIHLDWRPRPYSGRVVLYRNRIPRHPGRDSALMGWDGLVASDTPVLLMTEQYRNFSGINIRFVAESARRYFQAAKEATRGEAIASLS